jgi:hypothetical protein
MPSRGAAWAEPQKKRKKMFFFEKKNQKTFVPVPTLPARLAPTVKSFLLLFFKKEDLSFLVSKPHISGAAGNTWRSGAEVTCRLLYHSALARARPYMTAVRRDSA